MFRTAHTLGCILVLTVIAVLVTPGISQAQRGGGRGEGGHYGGASVGGYRAGAYRGPASYGGYRYPSVGYGYRPYYGSYSPYFYGVPTYDYGYSNAYPLPLTYGDATYNTPTPDTYQAYYPPPAITIPSDTRTDISVTVPPGAEIWFDDTATTSTGTVRLFHSPPLTPGKHSYEIRARWNENGREVIQTQRVEVTPGAQVNVSFPLPSATSGQTVKKG